MAKLEVIARALSRTRGSAPATDPPSQTSDEVRAFLQKRVAGLGLLLAALFSLFLTWRTVTVLVEVVQDGPADWGSIPSQAGEVALFLGIWLLCRGRDRSIRFLRAVDILGTLLGMAAVLIMPFRIPYPVRPDYIVILALSYILLVRSIYIPSTARRTLTLGVTVAPMLLASLFVIHYVGHDPSNYSSNAHPMVRSGPTGWAIRWTIIGGVWWAASVILATVTSRVFYGLREEVRDARKLGQYTLLEKLGEGGMGIVYRASHALLRRPTAVQLLPPENLGEEKVARFEREVQLTALLTHPNTVRIFDYGRTPNQTFYYAMELLEGASLLDAVKVGGPMPAARVIHVMQQIAGALSEAHGIGLIHRDIKPANIILTEQGGVPDVAKVVDFGLVKDLGGTGEAGVLVTLEALTQADRIAGTPQYMAPEAITTPELVDARTDLYALGAVGYFLLAGVDVFRGRTVVEVCSHHLHTEPLAPSRRVDRVGDAPVPADLEAVILRCLAKDPADRPATARALRALLAGCADASSWTEEDARAWWTGHAEALRAPRAAEVAGRAPTLAVDLDRREAKTVHAGVKAIG